MARKSKRFRKIASIDKQKLYSLDEAIDILKEFPPVKFDQSVEIALKLGVDPRRSDQTVRGTVALPNGTGKTMRILVFAKGEKLAEAKAAGADYAGHEELLEKVAGGWTEFDAVVATPDMMREVGKLGKVLGPRGLMPTPKAGTVTTDITKAIEELRKGKVEFKSEKAVINKGLGKLSFTQDQLKQNIIAFLTAVVRAKPANAKGHYLRSLYLSSTMGPGCKIDISKLDVS